MRYILGMAKSFEDLKGGRSSTLELDYLRLVYAVKKLRKRGNSAQGYLVVLNTKISDRVERWKDKYQGGKCVEVIDISLPTPVKNKLKKEKASNRAGMIAVVTGGEAGGRSSANFGREVVEKALKRRILTLEPNVEQVKDERKFPCGIRWDFYGVVD